MTDIGIVSGRSARDMIVDINLAVCSVSRCLVVTAQDCSFL